MGLSRADWDGWQLCKWCTFLECRRNCRIVECRQSLLASELAGGVAYKLQEEFTVCRNLHEGGRSLFTIHYFFCQVRHSTYALQRGQSLEGTAFLNNKMMT